MNSELKHHPDEATLISYANGTLSDSLKAVVASHLSFCEKCRKEVELLQALGGALLEDVQSVEMSDGALDKALSKFDEIFIEAGGQNNADNLYIDVASLDDTVLPQPIQHVLGMSIDEIPWSFMAPGIRCYKIPTNDNHGELRLLKIKPGHSLPEHGHGGSELTLVLQGAYKDEFGTYQRGDIQDVDDDIEHQPVTIGDEDCICLIAFEHQAKFKNIAPRVLQPLIGM